MGMLKDEDKNYIRQQFQEKLGSPVKLILFTQKLECEYCQPTEEILTELSDLSDNLSLDVRNFQIDSEDAKKYGVDKVPAIILLGQGDTDYGIRFFGIPSGYEFSTLLTDILTVSGGKTELPQELADKVAGIDAPVEIKVFVTPTCPYCSQAVKTAHNIAMANPAYIKAHMIESVEFPQLANRYGVYGVPKTIINEKVQFEGAMPDAQVVEQLLSAVKKSEADA